MASVLLANRPILRQTALQAIRKPSASHPQAIRKPSASHPNPMHKRKNPIKINEGFKCIKCKIDIKPNPDGSCRNHCSHCLWSLHVDLEVPGDRLNDCKGLMKPVGVEMNKKKGARVIHVCQSCGHKGYNRSASDDNWDLICELSRIPQG